LRGVFRLRDVLEILPGQRDPQTARSTATLQI